MKKPIFSISNFSTNEEILPFVKKSISYLFLLFLLNIGIGNYLKTFETIDLKDKEILFESNKWEDYNQQDHIDLLILGSSHAAYGYDPITIANTLDDSINIFNFASAAQAPITSYALLEEVLQKHHPSLIVFDLYTMIFTSTDQYKRARFNWQAIPEGAQKKRFFKNAFFLKDKILLLLFPTKVYGGNFKPKLKKLLGLPYLKKKKGTYGKQGFLIRKDSISTEQLQNYNQFDVFTITQADLVDHNIEHAQKMVNLCKEKGIPLIFTVAPMPEISVQKFNNYHRIDQYFQKKSKEWSIPFYNFNISPKIGLKDQYHFYDDDHLNLAGALLFSKHLSKNILQEHLIGSHER